MSGKAFVDTNVLIYAHDAGAGVKRDIAAALLRQLWETREGVLSMQVLQEFYVNATKKIRTPLAKPVARGIITTYAPWCVEGPVPADLTAAYEIEDSAKIGFWDALIVAAAARAGAVRILSEDLNNGQSIAGLVIENPF